jgi:hypothetical protein
MGQKKVSIKLGLGQKVQAHDLKKGRRPFPGPFIFFASRPLTWAN